MADLPRRACWCCASRPAAWMSGPKNDVINIVRDLRAKGLAIIVLSTEPETVLSLADRILVLKRGVVVREFVDGGGQQGPSAGGGVDSMIRKSAKQFSLATDAERVLRGDHAQTDG